MSSDQDVKSGLESVDIVVQLLEVLAQAPAPMGVSELARALGETKSRVHRNLSSLKHHHFVDQVQETEKYHLGWKLFQLAERASLEFNIRDEALPFLQFLSRQSGLSTLLAVPFNGEALVVDAIANEGNISISVKPGNRPIPHCSAQGRIALAYASDEQRGRLLAGTLHSPSPEGLTDKKKIAKRLQSIRTHLYEDAPNETLMGINVLAVPVFRHPQDLVGILSVVGSIQHLPAKPPLNLLNHLQACAKTLSEHFGSQAYSSRRIDMPAQMPHLSQK
jgi:DNA-binding IclR family transcriptional regulator